MDVGVVQVHDIITQLRKFDSLSDDTQKAVDKAQAIISDSDASRTVHTVRQLLKIYYLLSL